MVEDINLARNIDIINRHLVIGRVRFEDYIGREPISHFLTFIIAKYHDSMFPMPLGPMVVSDDGALKPSEYADIELVLQVMYTNGLLDLIEIKDSEGEEDQLAFFTEKGLQLYLDGGLEKEVRDRHSAQRLQRETNSAVKWSSYIQAVFIAVTAIIIFLDYRANSANNEIQERQIAAQTVANQLQAEQLIIERAGYLRDSLAQLPKEAGKLPNKQPSTNPTK